jgi:hypothetical protein
VRITGVGSLPHDDAAQAAAFVSATTDIAYLPQLPNRHPSEGMLRQWGDGLCGVGGVDEGIGLRFGAPEGDRAEAFGGAAAMLRAGTLEIVKTQVTGPLTITLALLAAGAPRHGIWDCVVDGLSARLADHVALIESEQPGAEIITVVDEPALVMYAPHRDPGPIPVGEAAEGIARVLIDAPVPLGIHVCGDTDWRTVAGLRPAWLSWDLAALGDGFLTATDALAQIVSEGTGIMWGMVPTDPAPIDQDRVRSRYGTAVTRLVLEGAPIEALARDSLATPACGLAGLSVGGADAVMERLRATVEALDG